MTQDRTSGVAWAELDRESFDGTSTMDLSGRCVGSSYILQHPIGQGATGTVWRGLDRASGQPVAVKLLHESLLRQPKLVTRFVQERTILLMLRHRNVVRVRDLFSVGETLGLVMDLVDGGSLRDHLREHRTIAAGEAARLSAQVAAALAEAHELGVVHRDLKPDNILLQRRNGRLETRLTDFGVARILNTPSMTTPNAVVGTPHYMAPEAFHGTTASPATDVYALGVLVYELITGRPPYESDSIPDLMRRHMEGDPERRPGIPDPIWDVIASCMATKRRLRPCAPEIVAALSDAARTCADVPALPRSERRHGAHDPGAGDSLDERWGRDRGPAELSAAPGRQRRGECRDLAGFDSVSLAGGPVAVGRRGLGRAGGPASLEEVSQWAIVPAADGDGSAGGHASLGRPGQGEGVPAADGDGSAGGPAHSEGTAPRAAESSRARDGRARGRWPNRGRKGAGGRGPGAEQAGGGGRSATNAGGRGPGDGGGPNAVGSGGPAPGAHDGGGGAGRRAGRWAAVIAAVMVALAVVATVWDFRRGDREAGAARVAVTPSGTAVTKRAAAAAPSRKPRRAAAGPGAVVTTSPTRHGGTAPVRSGAFARVPSKMPEAQPYGPWQCTPGFAVDFRSGTPLAPKPCQMVGRDIRYRGSLTAPGGATGSITVALQDAASGRTVSGPKTCDGLTFGGDAATASCGPASASPVRGRRYAVVMSYRYERRGRTVASMSRGSVFSW